MRRFAMLAFVAACGRIDYAALGGGDGQGDGADGQGDGPDGAATTDGGTGGCVFGPNAQCPDDVRELTAGVAGLLIPDLGLFTDDREAPCGGSGGGDFIVRFDAVDAGTYRLSVDAMFPLVFYDLPDTNCASPPLNCITGGGFVQRSVSAGESFLFAVDSDGACGVFTLRYDWQ